MVVTIMRWTGREARLLRETALRMSIRDFAAHTNLSTYAIRDFEAKGDLANLRISTQRILDDAFAGAPEDGKLRFTAALHATPSDDIGALGQTVTAPNHLPRPRQPEARVLATGDGPGGKTPTGSLGHDTQSSTTASGQTDAVEDDAIGAAIDPLVFRLMNGWTVS